MAEITLEKEKIEALRKRNCTVKTGNRFEGLDIRLMEEEIEDDEPCYTVLTECWFDVDKVFGTETRDDDDVWVNFYLRYYPETRNVRPEVHLDAPNGIIEIPFEFTNEEKDYMRALFANYTETKYGKTPLQLWKEDNDTFYPV